MKNNLLVTIIVALVVGATGFYGGTLYQKSQASNFASLGYNPGGPNMGRRFGNGNGQRPVVGKVISQDANTLTIQLIDGSSKIVDITGKTTYSKTSTASASDLKTGDTVAAIGPVNSDGSITAQTIQLNPTFRMRPQGTPPTQ